MRKTELGKAYDPTDYLTDERDYILYLRACFDEGPGDGSLIRSAVLDIAKAQGMTEVARKSGLSRDGLYKALSPEGNPGFTTMSLILKALGVQLNVQPA